MAAFQAFAARAAKAGWKVVPLSGSLLLLRWGDGGRPTHYGDVAPKTGATLILRPSSGTEYRWTDDRDPTIAIGADLPVGAISHDRRWYVGELVAEAKAIRGRTDAAAEERSRALLASVPPRTTKVRHLPADERERVLGPWKVGGHRD